MAELYNNTLGPAKDAIVFTTWNLEFSLVTIKS